MSPGFLSFPFCAVRQPGKNVLLIGLIWLTGLTAALGWLTCPVAAAPPASSRQAPNASEPINRAKPSAAAGSQKAGLQVSPLSLIPPGTHFNDEPPEGWSHLISMVHTRLSRGDVDEVPETVQYYAELFNLVMLASAVQIDTGQYVLERVGIGFSMEIEDQNTIVTAETQKQFGGNLSMVGRSVLDGNLDALEEVRQLARTRQAMLIEAPAILLRDGKHREMHIRYFVWAFPGNGNIGTVAWLVDPAGRNSEARLPDQTVQLLPAGLQEDRQINVKAEKFNFLGIPADDAFAMIQIPQGKPFEMSESFRQVAGLKRYEADAFSKLISAVAETLRRPQSE